jgi:hypothetical protein
MSGVSTAHAHVYHRTLDPNSQDSLARFARLIPPGSRVLDLGAGPGVLGRYLAEHRDCTVDGVEYNPVAVAEASALVSPPGMRRPGTASLLADVSPVQPLRFHPLRRYPGTSASTRRAARAVARPAGSERAGAAVGAERGLCRTDRRVAGRRFPLSPEGLLDETHLRFFTHDSLLRLLEACGLRSVALGRDGHGSQSFRICQPLDRWRLGGNLPVAR